MSAYQCGETTIQTVVAILSRGERLSMKSLVDLGQSLTDMNSRAVDTRYSSTPEQIRYCHADVFISEHHLALGDPSHICPLVKTLDCFIYQCSEGNVPEERLYKQCVDARRQLVERVFTSLPAYREAPWT